MNIKYYHNVGGVGGILLLSCLVSASTDLRNSWGTSHEIDNGGKKYPGQEVPKYNGTEDYEDEVPLSRKFHIGGILPNESVQKFFHRTIEYLNFDGVSVSSTCTLYHVTVISSGSPIRDARLVCNQLIAQGVFVMIIGGGNMSSAATSAVSYTGGFYHIPVIGTSARESAFSDKNIHVSFLRTVPPLSHQADVWVELVKRFGFQRAVFIHSPDTDGRAILGRLRTLSQDAHNDKAVKVTSVIEYDSSQDSIIGAISPLQESTVRVFLLYAKEDDATRIFSEAKALNQTGKGTVWILSEESLRAKNAPVGAIGLRLKYAKNQRAHIADSLRLVTLALKKMHDNHPEMIIRPPNTCDREEPWNITGKLLFKAIQEEMLFNGETGKVAFDSKGDRKFAEYYFVNVQPPSHFSDDDNNELTVFGEYYYNKEKDEMKLEIEESKIVWGGGEKKTPSGISVPRNLKVLTIEETPFLYSENVSESESNCDHVDESICIYKNPHTKEISKRCCYGYCVELLKRLADTNDFSFTLHLSGHHEFGENFVGKKGTTVWTGMVGELINQTNGADMIVAPLTINPERSQVIDFSKPFKYQGITILVKKAQKSTDLVSILQPFQFNLWMMLLATVHGIALLVWLLDRLSPMFKSEGKESDSLKISEAFWFSWGVILNSGLGEGTPRCLSSRVMSMIWAGFAMIIVASYTANLAAFLVLEDRGETISGINDAKLRNPVEDFRFGTVKSSSVDMFFRRKTEWSNMYRVMEANNFDSAESAIEAVRNGSLKAFIWDSSRLEYEAARDCNLVTVGELFGRSGYGIGIRRGLFWSEKITLDILEFHESGFMADLDDKWIWQGGPECPPDRSYSPQRLGLANLEGIFMMIVGGVAAGIILILVELTYEKYKVRWRELNLWSSSRLSEGIQSSSSIPQSSCLHPSKGVSAEVNQEQASIDECECCRENEKTLINSICSSCSHLISGSYEHNRVDGRSYFAPDLESRLRESCHVPEKLKELTPHEWLRFQIQNRGTVPEKSHPETMARTYCTHSLSNEDLISMLDFVEEFGVNEFPRCSCQEDRNNAINESSKKISESGIANSQSCTNSSSSDSDSIISGEYSCSLMNATQRRRVDELPDVIFTKDSIHEEK